MSDLPPPYDSISHIYKHLPHDSKRKVEELVSATLSVSSKDVKSAVVKAIHEKLSDPAFQDKFAKEVETLCGNVLKLNRTFQEVNDLLGKVDANSLPGSTKYQGTWNTYQQV